jgi:thioredoxin 1
MTTHLKEFSDSTFDDVVLANRVPVLVDFWAPWCGPCQSMNPVIEEIAEQTAGQWVVGKLNIQDNPQTAAKLGIRSIPVIMLFNEGQCRATLVGTQTKQNLLEKMNDIVS